MSRNAARAMRDLAECLDEEGHAFSGPNKALLHGMARAHRKADRIEAWSGDVGQGSGR